MATAAADLARFRELNGDRPPTAEELSQLNGLDVALCAEILKSPQQEVEVEKPQETGTEQPKKRRRTKKPEASAEVAAEESAKGPKTAAKAKASTRQTKPKEGRKASGRRGCSSRLQLPLLQSCLLLVPNL